MVQSQGPPLSRFSLTGLNCSAGPATAPAFVVDLTAIRRLRGVRAVAPQWCGRGPHLLQNLTGETCLLADSPGEKLELNISALNYK